MRFLPAWPARLQNSLAQVPLPRASQARFSAAAFSVADFSGAAAIGAASLWAADVFVFVDQISAADSNANAADRTGGVASFAALSEVAPSCATDGSFPFMFATVLTPSESHDAMPRVGSPAQAPCSHGYPARSQAAVLIVQRASRQSTWHRHMIVVSASPRGHIDRTDGYDTPASVPPACCSRNRSRPGHRERACVMPRAAKPPMWPSGALLRADSDRAIRFSFPSPRSHASRQCSRRVRGHRSRRSRPRRSSNAGDVHRGRGCWKCALPAPVPRIF